MGAESSSLTSQAENRKGGSFGMWMAEAYFLFLFFFAFFPRFFNFFSRFSTTVR